MLTGSGLEIVKKNNTDRSHTGYHAKMKKRFPKQKGAVVNLNRQQQHTIFDQLKKEK
jgi:hypothetical protein